MRLNLLILACPPQFQMVGKEEMFNQTVSLWMMIQLWMIYSMELMLIVQPRDRFLLKSLMSHILEIFKNRRLRLHLKEKIH